MSSKSRFDDLLHPGARQSCLTAGAAVVAAVAGAVAAVATTTRVILSEDLINFRSLSHVKIMNNKDSRV